MQSLGVRFHGGQQPGQADLEQYAAWYLASDEWAGQVAGLDEREHGRSVSSPAGADSLPPAEAVAEGRRAAAAISAN